MFAIKVYQVIMLYFFQRNMSIRIKCLLLPPRRHPRIFRVYTYKEFQKCKDVSK